MKNIRPVLYCMPGLLLVLLGLLMGPRLSAHASSGTWTATGSLNTARSQHTAILLPSGKVLIAGGWNNNTMASAELYDPSTGTWTVTGSLNTTRSLDTAILLPSGKVLIAGGSGGVGGNVPLASTELYDPSTGTWTVTGSLNTARLAFDTVTLLPSGKVLIAGGLGSGSAPRPQPNSMTRVRAPGQSPVP